MDEGYARLPGAGYQALHPELEGIDPEDYPEIHKMRILADVAPYSREYQKHAAIVRHQAKDDPELEAEYERISEQVRQTKESTLQVAQRHFNAPVDTIEGTVKSASAQGVELAEYPGRTFRFSSVGSSMADLTRSLPRRAHIFFARAAGRPEPSPAESHAGPGPCLSLHLRPRGPGQPGAVQGRKPVQQVCRNVESGCLAWTGLPSSGSGGRGRNGTDRGHT